VAFESFGYPKRAAAFQARRLWVGLVGAVGFAGVALVTTFAAAWAAAGGCAAIAAHAAARRLAPGRTAMDSLALDAVITVGLVAVLGPPTLSLVVLGAVLGMEALLFLPARATAWLMALVGLAFAVAQWAAPALTAPQGGVLGIVVIGGVALLPMLAWLLQELGKAGAEIEGLAAALDKSARRFEKVFHRAAMPNFRTTFEGLLLDTNQAMLELLGSGSLEELRSHSLEDRYLEPEGRARFLEMLRADGEVRGHEVALRRLDGTLVWGRMSAVLVTDEDGSAVIEGSIEDITAWRESHRQSQFARFLLDQVASAVIATGVEGEVTFWNEGAVHLYGWSAAEVLGQPARRFLVPATLEKTAELAAAALGAAGHWEGEIDAVRSDGVAVRCLASVKRLPDHDDLPGGTVIVLTDIGELDMARRNVHLQARLLDQVNNAVVATDLAGAVVYWNSFAETMFGWTAEEVSGRSLSEVTLPGLSAEKAAGITSTLMTDGVWQDELVFLRRDGTRFPAWSSDTLLRDPDGTPIGVVAIMVDLTERKAVEAEARRQGELARSVLESVAMPMAVIDSDGIIRAVNRAWEDFARANGGDPRQSGAGKSYLGACERTDDPGALDAMRGVAAVLAGDQSRFTMEYDCHAPGEDRWFRMEATPIPGMGAVVAHWNVTEERLAQASLEDLIRSKDEFIASVSHELRTPLTAVVGLATELRDGEFPAAEVDEFHRLIADQAQEVSYIVEDLLVAARADTDTLSFHPRIIDLRHEVDGVLSLTRHRGAPTVEVHHDGDAVLGFADPARIRQVLRNLLGNAIRHGSPPIVVEVENAPGGVRVAVTDSGSGIPPEGETLMFQPYARFAERSGQPSSVGLGLFVSRRLMELMGGSLSYSREQSQTVFTMIVPEYADSQVVSVA